MKAKVVAVTMAMLMATSLTAFAGDTDIAQFKDGWGDTNSAFDPLTFDDAITFNEMREQLGAIPKSDDSF